MRLPLLAALAMTAIGAPTASAQMDKMDKSKPASPDAASYGSEVQKAYERVRAATVPFQKLEAAVAAGYAATVESCLANPAQGGMGYHHINRGYLDKTLEIDRPEILLYERRADGSYALNGVEYIVPYRVWPADSVPPRIMGRDLQRADDLKLWYMHMWAWTPNPAGLFANWNPDVSCRQPPA